jgi:hypothetical protein
MDDPASNPALIDTTLDARATSFENLTGARGAGGQAHGGRKGAPNRQLEPGERVVLADIEGTGVIRHFWMTFLPGRPERMRSLYLEVFYDGADEPSISVPCLDFFGVPHGRPVAYHSALTSANEGRGFNSYVPMPFRNGVRVELVNAAPRRAVVYYQIDYTLQPSLPEGLGYLHVSFRRENPTVQRRDFIITDGLQGPGRYLGCNVGVRIIDEGTWYGEGEVKVYRDGDRAFPTICGTGLEDYVGSAWGMGAHSAPYGGAPLVVGEHGEVDPDFVGFYRWHLLDPIMFARDLRVTIQQIGAMFFTVGQEEQLAAYEKTNPVAGAGWSNEIGPDMLAWGIVERVDDFCATAYVYCTDVQPVAPLDLTAALADIGRRDYESASPMERLNSVVDPRSV